MAQNNTKKQKTCRILLPDGKEYLCDILVSFTQIIYK